MVRCLAPFTQVYCLSCIDTTICRLLLKYRSRDEVGLLGKGTGGVLEAQEAVNNYEEQSPLFGFIQHRRRKVILKYVPEGTSRLLQGMFEIRL